MNISKSLLVGTALVASLSASAGAQVYATVQSYTGTFLSLSGPGQCFPVDCTLGGTVANIAGGSVFGGDLPFADIPKGSLWENKFLAAGPNPNIPVTGPLATMTFTTPVSNIGFLWGSPDLFNQLTVNSTGGSQIFTVGPTSLNFAVTDGNQAFSQYVRFSGVGNAKITSLVFTNVPAVDAFEAGNFSVVPEPSTYALMAAGLAGLAFASKRRKRA
jgi:hypothetical protein